MTPTCRLKICGLLFFALAMELGAQQGFNKGFHFGGNVVFENLLIDNDTVVLIGVIAEPGVNKVGKMWLKMDTLGNVLAQKIYYDSLGSFGYVENTSIIKLSDGSGYAFVGIPRYTEEPRLFLVDNEGGIRQTWDYPEPSSVSDILNKLVETSDGFYLSGRRHFITPYSGTASVYHVDKTGKLRWKKDILTPKYIAGVGSFVRLDDNTLVVGGGYSVSDYAGTSTPVSSNFIIAIDSLGNQKWKYEPPVNNEDVYVAGLQKTPDGGWLYGSRKIVPYGNGPEAWNAQSVLVKRDSNFNLVWSRAFGDSTVKNNAVFDLEPTPDGQFVAVGYTQVDYSPFKGGQAGFLHKFSPDGDSLWFRADTLTSISFTPPPLSLLDGTLCGVGCLSSGSVVACGYSVGNQEGFTRQYGWVIKISPDGCVDTLLCATSPAPEPLVETAGPSFSVSPNPSTGLFQISVQNAPANTLNFKVFDAAGRLVRSEFAGSAGAAFSQTLDLTELPAGLYLLQISDGQSVGALRLAKF